MYKSILFSALFVYKLECLNNQKHTKLHAQIQISRIYGKNRATAEGRRARVVHVHALYTNHVLVSKSVTKKVDY